MRIDRNTRPFYVGSIFGSCGTVMLSLLTKEEGQLFNLTEEEG